MRRFILSTFLAAGLASQAPADHYMQSADPGVVSLINQVVAMYQQACQFGNPTGCQLAEMAMSDGHYLLNAGYDCQYGNQAACNYYQQGVWSLQTYAAQMQQAQLGGGGMGNPLGATHAERMQNIHNWGQSRMAWGQQQSQMMDQRHQQFMESLRN